MHPETTAYMAQIVELQEILLDCFSKDRNNKIKDQLVVKGDPKS